MNGDVWTEINVLRKDIQEIATDGCAHKRVHDSYIHEIREERKERIAMGEKLLTEMRSVRNQVILSIVLVMALALVVDKIIK